MAYGVFTFSTREKLENFLNEKIDGTDLKIITITQSFDVYREHQEYTLVIHSDDF